jgi:hypothetical protein
MILEKVVTPVKTGVQRIFNYLKKLDSGSPLSLGQASPE